MANRRGPSTAARVDKATKAVAKLTEDKGLPQYTDGGAVRDDERVLRHQYELTKKQVRALAANYDTVCAFFTPFPWRLLHDTDQGT